MKCPFCGAWTEIVDSRKKHGQTWRRRRCGNDHRYNTYEVLDDDWKTLQQFLNRNTDQIGKTDD